VKNEKERIFAMKVKALVHSLRDLDDVEIISHTDNNNVVAEYKGKRYTAIFNVFTFIYYVDDIYGEIKES
jgi:hypothetical protein